jgi:hypothetical protein
VRGKRPNKGGFASFEQFADALAVAARRLAFFADTGPNGCFGDREHRANGQAISGDGDAARVLA